MAKKRNLLKNFFIKNWNQIKQNFGDKISAPTENYKIRGLGKIDFVCLNDLSKEVLLIDLRIKPITGLSIGRMMSFIGYHTSVKPIKEGYKIKGIIIGSRLSEKGKLALLCKKDDISINVMTINEFGIMYDRGSKKWKKVRNVVIGNQ